MELIAKAEYHNAFCSLQEGVSTAGLDIPEEVKAQMLADFPELFEQETGEVAGTADEADEAKPKSTRKK